jgi:hypothetical protein
VKTSKFKKLLLVGLGNIVSGICFGLGCIAIEHIDNTWWHAEKDPSQQEEVAQEETPTSTPVSLTATKAAKPDSNAPKLVRHIKQ